MLPDTSAMPAARPAIDRRTLARLCEALGENGAQLLPALVASYLDDTATLLASMHRALDEEDVESLQRDAHRLKSSSAFLGAATLAGLCGDLERHCQGGAIAGCDDYVLQIAAEYADVEAALEQQRENRNTSAVWD
jgi:HPt (histidine-containing phosphotransfer) domain-containing protein